MNKLQKAFIRNEFFASINGFPSSKNSVMNNYHLKDLQEFVLEFINDLENKINLYLNALITDFQMEVKFDKKNSDRTKIVFYTVNLPDEKYVLSDDLIKPLNENFDEKFIKRAKEKRSKNKNALKYYKETISVFNTMSIPITDRVNWCYDFFDECYFFLKNINGVGGIKIYIAYDENYKETEKVCYFKSIEFKSLLEKIIVPNDYILSFDNIKEFVSRREKKAYNEIIEDIAKQNKVKELESTLEQQLLEVIKTQKELSELTGKLTRIILTESRLFERVDGIKYIKKIWLPYLRFINLAKINFEGVNISGVDFSYSNASINPQKVYNKDLSNCRFVSFSEEEWIFNPMTDFTGCKLNNVYIDDAPVSIGINLRKYNDAVIKKKK